MTLYPIKKLFISIFAILLLSLFIQGVNKKEGTIETEKLVELIEYTPWYVSLTDSCGLSKGALFSAYKSFTGLLNKGLLKNDSIISIVDYSKPSSEKRLYVIDIKNQKLLMNSLVAHGQNSGTLYAEKFSNRPQSHMSSLGAFITAQTYTGNHGYSLRLIGLEKGLNNNAYTRAIVIHGASYVNEKYIETTGRIGRSFGCPALPHSNNKTIIDFIKDGSCFYVYHPSENM